MEKSKRIFYFAGVDTEGIALPSHTSLHAL